MLYPVPAEVHEKSAKEERKERAQRRQTLDASSFCELCVSLGEHFFLLQSVSQYIS